MSLFRRGQRRKVGGAGSARRHPEDSPVAQRLPRGCTRILLAWLRGSGRSQASGAAPAASRAKSRRPPSSRAPPARRVMAGHERRLGSGALCAGSSPRRVPSLLLNPRRWGRSPRREARPRRARCRPGPALSDSQVRWGQGRGPPRPPPTPALLPRRGHGVLGVSGPKPTNFKLRMGEKPAPLALLATPNSFRLKDGFRVEKGGEDASFPGNIGVNCAQQRAGHQRSLPVGPSLLEHLTCSPSYLYALAAGQHSPGQAEITAHAPDGSAEGCKGSPPQPTSNGESLASQSARRRVRGMKGALDPESIYKRCDLSDPHLQLSNGNNPSALYLIILHLFSPIILWQEAAVLQDSQSQHSQGAVHACLGKNI